MGRGVPQSYYVDEFADQGIMLESMAGPPDYLAMGIPLAGPAHRELMLDHRRVGQCGLMVADTSRGADNLWVSDGSVVPSALDVNPQITIMALATRLAFHLKGAPCPSSSTPPGSAGPAAPAS
jgi:hypothetical protein